MTFTFGESVANLKSTNMISVIMPTMWQGNRAIETLKALSKYQSVGEIILIDNSETPPDLKIDKLVHIKEYKNTYVNPAWNKGYRLAKFDKLLFVNDDVQTNWGFINAFGLNTLTWNNGIGRWSYFVGF